MFRPHPIQANAENALFGLPKNQVSNGISLCRCSPRKCQGNGAHACKNTITRENILCGLGKVKGFEIDTFGPLFHYEVIDSVLEEDMEFNVWGIKAIFTNCVVFYWVMTHDLNLENSDGVPCSPTSLSIEMAILTDSPKFEGPKHTQVISILPKKEQGISACLFHYKPGTYPQATFSTVVKYESSETFDAWCEPVFETYELENVNVTVSDYVKPKKISDWDDEWNTIGEQNQMIECISFAKLHCLKNAAKNIISVLRMHPCNGTDVVASQTTVKHMLKLSGEWITGVPVLAKVLMRVSKDSFKSVMIHLTIRSRNIDANNLLAKSFFT